MTHNESTVRLTVGQAVIRFLGAQYVERDGVTEKFFGGAFGIFGHGNVAGIGQAMLQYQDEFPYYQGRNEQGMVHIATGYAKMRNRLGALAVSTSIGPGATNMVTGAGTATVNHLPVLLLPADVFATRSTGAVLQQQEMPYAADITANDAFRAVSRFFDRIWRPEQLAPSLLEAMRVLTSPADTGAVTIALPQDVQAEAYDFPASLFRDRVWHIARNRADRAALRRAAELIRGASKPIIIAGGGVIYSDATDALVRFAESTGIGVGVTQAGKASFPHTHELALGALGASGSVYANAPAGEADVVIGIGTRYTDFTTASNTLFRNPDVAFVNINVAEIDAFKEAATPLLGDARETLDELLELLGDWSVAPEVRAATTESASAWRSEIDRIIELDDSPTLSQAQMLGILNDAAGERDVVVNAAGSMPGDLHRLWRPGSTKGYDIEYGNSCMGYEIPGAIGNGLADRTRHVFGLIGDGTFLMLSQEIMTAVQEHLKITFVVVDNSGYGSIAALSETRGSQEFGTRFRERGEGLRHDGARIDVDFPANAASYGAKVWTADTADTFRAALEEAKAYDGTSVVYVRVDAQGRFGGSGAWWDVPVSEVSELESTQRARAEYDEEKANQHLYL
ncbi:3D-(3,5/4)-trihydroxycyclohexane-1,2-dione acylhydrolase (decyclizing) [Pseudoclavibacter chungangensis]|uniref:3D-(3,5/4)-trihydroxycyclohexane-1,2-dione acylhydrolase (Decyclizing) n=1 Tax=Pseudoclavibacter chungangensis TaxID=587635 RepID=A0A7J5BUL2_9MICO|nr:3D-(3,5/4)-trihydroxycyclohexane-1,2-dione acylhydrolase (decyclizing) [Pseudoclavibacter chungangensis]KAB1658039.1 3D-(3,5/4)-trihydroxycyclohexane-1,2-dione acylhydrolase (decyclizing) [Pseudoclavibacter chungangensis]NYJ65796.1 3D-(3,5/4)-trihydroxycyclohexane-1,2-dione acylhydrolase (decyclizing) [Pseudoclavibacter chungangensis]